MTLHLINICQLAFIQVIFIKIKISFIDNQKNQLSKKDDIWLTFFGFLNEMKNDQIYQTMANKCF